MISNEITLRNNSFYTVKKTTPSARANILVVHGLGEHIGRYEEVFQVFEKLGFNVYGYDRRGEGKSHGDRMYIKDIENHIKDLHALRQDLITNDLPTFLYGHSLGGQIVSLYLTQHQDIAGAIISGALIKISDDISPLLQKLSGIISAILPRLKTVKLNTDHLSRNPDIKPAYENDPLVYSGGTPASTGHQLIVGTKRIQARANMITTPLLITHGGDDKLSDPKGSRLLYESISSEDKELKIFDGLYHEIMHEPEKKDVFDCWSNWLSERI